ncbi:MAG: threonine/serine exporter family protein [Christensenellales bacterium]|jgi:uncharacterized membrane protein YjjB (DUF3815 family)
MMAVNLLGCFGAAAFFAWLFRTPARLVLPASLTAVAGYALSLVVGAWLNAHWAGVFVGSACAALIGEMLARKLRAPATIFLTVAIIPMVPGGGLYDTMLAIVQGRHADAAIAGANTMLSAGAIALGLSIAASAVFTVRKHRREGRR